MAAAGDVRLLRCSVRAQSQESAHRHDLYRVRYTHSTTTNPVIMQDLTCTAYFLMTTLVRV